MAWDGSIYTCPNSVLHCGVMVIYGGSGEKKQRESKQHGIKQGKQLEPLDESERGEWKNWPKTQHSKN